MKKCSYLIKTPKIRIVLILTLLLIIYITLCATSYATTISNDLSKSVFRLHVIANSDSKEDQELKYKVRDNLLNYMNKICSNCSSKKEAIKLVEENKDNFKNIAQNTIKDNGYNYNVNINIGNFEFPTKQYGDISLPAGYYDALRVEIGEAKGKNWWCVMFPPLCFVDISSGIVPEESKEIIKEELSNEEFALISDNTKNNNIKFKFKLLELFSNKDMLTAKK